MLDLDVIDQTIEELENADTTFLNCNNLASLYIVRDKLNQTKLDKELFDIIPSYKQFCLTKKKYQLKEVAETAVINDLARVCKEVYEFIDELYSTTESKDERIIITEMINRLYTNIKANK